MPAYRPHPVLIALLLVGCTAFAPATMLQAASDRGAQVFALRCATCHDARDNNRAPTLRMLRHLDTATVVTAMERGKMVTQAANLDEADRKAVAEFVTGRAVHSSAPTVTAQCRTHDPLRDSLALPTWNGWGRGDRNDRFQPAADAGITPTSARKLTLAWAFGFPDVTSARTQPTVIGRWLFTASDSGDVYALDARSGCIRWQYRARTAIRSAITLGSYTSAGASHHLLYFGDAQSNAYALDAERGTLRWMRKIEPHPNGWITGSPKVHAGRVYFTVSAALEEVGGSNPDYECCTFRGSVVALDMATGAPLWQTYSIAQAPQPRALNPRGVQQYGPAGGGIWNSPTIDAVRGVLYVGTGNGFADPPQRTTDAILAMDLVTGAVRWHFQATPGDVWLLSCDAGAKTRTANCPAQQGPDHDFGSAPLLVRTPTSHELLIAPQKSGTLWALDPDRNGAVVWRYQIGAGAAVSGQWGAASDGRNAYVGNASPDGDGAGGVHAVDLETGQRAWFTPAAPRLCSGGTAERCYAGQGAAVSATPGVVFAGSLDGGLRAYASADGALLWQFDTNRYFDTVNGVIARGATMDGPGPVVVDGTVYVNSGYNNFMGRAGNVLLAFRAQ